MLPNFKTAALATATALSMVLSSGAPAAAWGEREQDFLKGAVSALVLKAIIDDAKRDRYPQPVIRDEPRPRQHEDDGYYRDYYPKPQATSIYRTPVARAFKSYSSAERRLIQKRLSHWGYYRGSADGSFGPATYSAIRAYAQDQGYGRDLASMAGAYGVLDGLIF